MFWNMFIGPPRPCQFNVRELLAGRVHGHKRVQVEVGVDPDDLHLLLGD
jgi:hypothetical protein